MAARFFIIVPYLNDFEPSSGTTIRIAGYTRSLEELGVDYKFLSTIKPEYVPHDKHESFAMSRKWIKIILLHNIFYSNFWLNPLAIPLRFFLDHVAGIRKISKKVGDRLIWSHQENSLALYLYFKHQKTFIYDVHGFFDIQRDFRKYLSNWRKLWFDLHLKHERIVLKYASFINVVSARMGKYVKETFLPKGRIKLAPDGIPAPLSKYKEIDANQIFKHENNLSDEDKIILFAGSFKIIGGASNLLRVFIENENLNTKAVLVLIGSGQEEKLIRDLINSCKCKDRIFHLRPMSHDRLISYLKIANVIVCPDIKGNLYNEITPHIKIYDFIASGRSVVAPDFDVNKELFDPEDYNIFYYNDDHIDSLSNTICAALYSNGFKEKQKELEQLTYKTRTITYLNSFG